MNYFRKDLQKIIYKISDAKLNEDNGWYKCHVITPYDQETKEAILLYFQVDASCKIFQYLLEDHQLCL